MSKSKTAKAKAAIDEAQAALQAAEDALETPAKKAEATVAAIMSYDEDAAGDAPIEESQPSGHQPPPADIGPYPEKKMGECVAFSVADALIQLGLDANFSSSHLIHRTMIGVMFHPDGTVSAGAFVEARPEHFDRHAAGMLAIANAGGVAAVQPAEARKLFRS